MKINKRYVKLIVIFLILLITIGTIALYYSIFILKSSVKLQNKQNVAIEPSQKLTPQSNCSDNLSTEKECLSVLTSPLGEHRLNFSIDVPKTWRASLEKWSNVSLIYNSYNDNLAFFNFISPYHPHPYDSGLDPVNKLEFYDVTAWIGKNTKDSFKREQSSEDKKAYFDFLINLRKQRKHLDFSKCKTLYIYDTCAGAQETYVQSADGVFSGFAVIRTSSQAFQYDPTVYTYMAGNIAGKTIYIIGEFILYGELNRQIDQIMSIYDPQYNILTEESINQLYDNLPSDLQAQYDEILDVLGSVKVEASAR